MYGALASLTLDLKYPLLVSTGQANGAVEVEQADRDWSFGTKAVWRTTDFLSCMRENLAPAQERWTLPSKDKASELGTSLFCSLIYRAPLPVVSSEGEGHWGTD